MYYNIYLANAHAQHLFLKTISRMAGAALILTTSFVLVCASEPTDLEGNRNGLEHSSVPSAKVGDHGVARVITYRLARMLVVFEVTWSYASSTLRDRPVINFLHAENMQLSRI